ncbi:MAG: hypothetical protein KGL96_14140 [Hyphomicrobiales bacterium]|nr:hypothetical protein [Hyphomicrobiales bacterium]
MQSFSFGPRNGGSIQLAYTVADIQEEMRRYTELLRTRAAGLPDHLFRHRARLGGRARSH